LKQPTGEPKVDEKDIEAMKEVRCVVSFLLYLSNYLTGMRMRLQRYFYMVSFTTTHLLFTVPPQLFEAQPFADADEEQTVGCAFGG
jgi:hypothetical protein